MNKYKGAFHFLAAAAARFDLANGFNERITLPIMIIIAPRHN